MAKREIVVELQLSDKNAVAELGRLQTETRQYQQSLKLLNSIVDENGKATNRQKQQIGELVAKIENNRVKFRELKNDLSGATDAGLRFRDKMAEATIEAIKQSGVLGKLDAQYSTLQQELTRNNGVIAANEVAMKELRDEYRKGELTAKEYKDQLKAIKTENTQVAQSNERLEQEIKGVTAEIGKLDKRVEDLTADMKAGRITAEEFRRGVDSINKEVVAQSTAFQKGITDIKGYITSYVGVAGAVIGLVSVLKSASQTVEKFDAAQSNLAAILNTNKEGISSLTEEAKKYGATTAFTASQVSELQTELAKLGFTQGQIKDATPAVLDLAAATGTDLGNAATIAAQTLNAFQLEASETQRVVDVIAQSANLSAFDIDTFSAAMSNAAPAAKSVGIEIEQASAMLSALVDAGIPAEKAGTDLRNIFISLAKEGMTLDEAFSVVRGSQDQLTTAVKMFDQRAAGSAIILAENTDKLKRLEEGYIDAAGAAEQMAKTQLDNLKGDKLLLTSAWEGFVLSVEDGGGRVTEVLRGITSLLTDVLSSYSIMFAKSDDLLARQVGTGNGSALRAEASAKAYLDEAKAYLSSREQMILEDEDIAFRTISAEQAVARAQIDRAKSDGTLIQLQDVLGKKLQESEKGSQQYAFTMIRLKEITKELAVQDADQAKALDASTKATTKKSEAVRKLTADQLAQLDAENNVRSDALGNIFAQTGDGTTTPAVELQKEEEAELDSIVEQGLANRNALREEARIRDIKGITDLNAERALLEAEWQSGSIDSYEEYLARKDNLRRAEVENEMMAAAAISDLFGTIAAAYDKDSAEFKIFATAQALISTYLAATKALASAPPPYNYALAAATVAAGLANVAKIQGFEEGGYTSKRRRDDEPVGVVHANEYVVPAPIVRNPRGKRLIDELERMRMGHPVRYAPPFIGGGIGTNNNVRFVRGTGLAQTGITAADVATADLSRAIMSMPAPVVRVDEINRVQRRVNVIESISRT